MQQNSQSNPIKDSTIYKILTWQNKKQTLKYLAFVQIFFYLYIQRNNSLAFILSRFCVMYLLKKLIFSGRNKSKNDKEQSQIQDGKNEDQSQNDNEVISEESLRLLYVIVYMGLNMIIQFIRNIIQMKEKHKSIFKAALLMYLSQMARYLGDKLTLYIIVLSLFVIPKILEDYQHSEELRQSDQSQRSWRIINLAKSLINMISNKIPRHSELQRK